MISLNFPTPLIIELGFPNLCHAAVVTVLSKLVEPTNSYGCNNIKSVLGGILYGSPINDGVCVFMCFPWNVQNKHLKPLQHCSHSFFKASVAKHTKRLLSFFSQIAAKPDSSNICAITRLEQANLNQNGYGLINCNAMGSRGEGYMANREDAQRKTAQQGSCSASILIDHKP